MFELHKIRFEKSLNRFIEDMGDKTALRDACSYSLLNGGKRLRPLLVLMIAEALGDLDVMPSAIGVECFHTASLIADDLPCMDNDEMRRGVPSLHKAFGESIALLASYTLIASGYGSLYENAKAMKQNPKFANEADKRAVLCLEAATRCAGLQGATQGQFLDLFPPNLSLETLRDTLYKKTVTLFEISFLFGWLFGGGDIDKISLMQKCAYHLGMAFQIVDDLEDDAQDASKGSNIAVVLGREKAISCFEEEIASLEKALKEAGLWTPSFQRLVDKGLVARGSLLRNRS
jgi:geranylgeranyl diphosphate synthase type II